MARTGGCRRCGRCRRRTDAGSRRQSLSLSGDAVIATGPAGAAGPIRVSGPGSGAGGPEPPGPTGMAERVGITGVGADGLGRLGIAGLSTPLRLLDEPRPGRAESPGPGHPLGPPGIPRVSALDWQDLLGRRTGHTALLGRLDLSGLPGLDGVPGLVTDRLNDLGLPEHPLGCAGDPVRLSRSSRFSRSSRRLPDRPGIFRRSLSIRSMRNGLNRLQALIPGGPGRPRPLGRPGRLRLLGPLGGPGIRRARGEPRPGRAPGAPGTPRVP